MTDTTTDFDFNTADKQRSVDVIPAGTICTLQLTIRPGGVGDGGWLKRSADGEISRNTLRAILESARGIRPDDRSEAAEAARKVSGWADFDQLRFVARIGVRPPRDAYAAKNTILQVITT
jgi:hypothetical protein